MKKLTLQIFLLLVQAPLWAAATPWQTNPHGQVRLIAEDEQAPDHGPILFGIEFKTIPGWHVYWKNPGDAGYPPKTDWLGSEGLKQIEFLWPAPQRFALPGDLTALGYEGEVVYPVQAKIQTTGHTLHAQLQLNYLTCNDSCVPYKYTLVLDIPVGEKELTDTETAPLIKRWLAQVPTPVQALPSVKLRAGTIQTPQGAFAVIDLSGPPDALPIKDLDVFFDKNTVVNFGTPVSMKHGDGWRLQAPASSFTGQPLPAALALEFVVTGNTARGARFAVSDHQNMRLKKTAVAPVLSAAAAPAPAISEMGSVPAPSAPVSLLSILLLAFLGGLILNVMPCVLPVLSIKLLGLLQHAGHARRVIVIDALASAAGILASFLALASVAIGARFAGHAIGWGIQFQQPVFVGVLAVIVLLFALNLWGVFEINLPGAVAQLGATNREQEGFGTYFMSGLFATLLATPCSAPFLGTAMGFALSQSAAIILSIFLAAGIGMAAPYFLLAIFPQTVYWLPKPGAWMVYVRRGMGFLLTATFLWLAYVFVRQLNPARPVDHVTQSGATVPAIGWEVFSEEALAKELAAGHSVFIDITADWCFTCKVNEARVLSGTDVTQALRDAHVTLLRGDWTTHDPMIDAFLKRMGRAGIPFNALYVPEKAPVLFSEFLSKRAVLDALKNVPKGDTAH